MITEFLIFETEKSKVPKETLKDLNDIGLQLENGKLIIPETHTNLSMYLDRVPIEYIRTIDKGKRKPKLVNEMFYINGLKINKIIFLFLFPTLSKLIEKWSEE